jgi:hypothetical protein
LLHEALEKLLDLAVRGLTLFFSSRASLSRLFFVIPRNSSSSPRDEQKRRL